MLISMDLLQHIQRSIYKAGSPAQLCIMRRMATDNEYVFRVRHGDAYLDYPFSVPLFDSAYEVEHKVNFDGVIGALIAMSKLVVSPSEISVNQVSQSNSNYMQQPSPCVLPPVV